MEFNQYANNFANTANAEFKSETPQDYIKAEEQHLHQFILDTRYLFEFILAQKRKVDHHLCEFFQRIQSRRYIFATRVTQLKLVADYLDFEIVVIYEYLEILEAHHRTLLLLSTTQDKSSDSVPMPNMLTVRQVAFDTLDRIFGFQARLTDELIIPLDSMEQEFQNCIFSDLAGFTSWQQDLEKHGPWKK